MNILAQAGTADQRSQIFATLRTRNRVVEVLRFAVPALGIVVFGGLVLRLFLVNLGEDFGFSNISIDRNNLVVDTPSYTSMGADGSSYQVHAVSARSSLERTDIIQLSEAVLTVSKPSGVVITASADQAQLETTGQIVTVEGAMRIADSKGMKGTLIGIVADLAAETVSGSGAVDITFSNGATLQAAGMSYDGNSSTWHFDRATLVMQTTPGEQEQRGAPPPAPPPTPPPPPPPGSYKKKTRPPKRIFFI